MEQKNNESPYAVPFRRNKSPITSGERRKNTPNYPFFCPISFQNTPGNLPNTPAFASFPTNFFLKTLENQSQNSRKLFFLLTLFVFFPYFFHDRSCTELALLVHFNHFERFLKVFFPKRQISDEKISTTGRDFRQYYHVFTLTSKFGFDKS